MVTRQHQRLEIRQTFCQIRLNMPYSVPRQQQRTQSRRQGEVGNGGDVVIGEVNGIMRASDTKILYCRDFVACG